MSDCLMPVELALTFFSVSFNSLYSLPQRPKPKPRRPNSSRRIFEHMQLPDACTYLNYVHDLAMHGSR
ncbi:unnamed protein product [Linum trigynum]|uniref:Uncharacterized protein n=1 Tax=Linum trigynum TaxID=586398 RepID=A0AAV2G2D1_9ROSI